MNAQPWPPYGGVQLLSSAWQDYELLDCGHWKKLERFGRILLIRSEPKAWWSPRLPSDIWQKALGEYHEDTKWNFRGKPPLWTMRFEELTLEARCTESSKHIGLFPEQAPHWLWIKDQLQRPAVAPCRVLSLFGYTGVASLIAAAQGAEVTHVDASQPALNWAKRNQELSGLQHAKLRWILDDALKFVKREIRREKQYDALILDPPSFGRGPKREVWKIQEQIGELLDTCRQVLTEHPAFVLLTLYSIDASSLMIGNLLQEMLPPTGQIEVGELLLQGTTEGVLLPMSIFGRWSANLEPPHALGQKANDAQRF